jgi:hypothetical protein
MGAALQFVVLLDAKQFDRASPLSVKMGGGAGVVGRASSQILGASSAKSADDCGPVIRPASYR